jgi:nucleotide-binding universal stress UspA family protein
MKRILVPVDFSAHSEISCQYALGLAVATGAEIILFHSFFDQFYYSDGGLATGFESGLMMTDEIILDLYNQKKSMLDKIAGQMNAQLQKEGISGISISTRLDSGDPQVQIIQATSQIKPDIIIMGSAGLGKKGLMAGSVARRIIEHTDLPVIAVPANRNTAPLQNIAYMTTFDSGDLSVIPVIDNLFSAFRTNIFCLHLTKEEPDPQASGNMINLSDKLLPLNQEGRITFHILKIDHEREVIGNFMNDHQISLIAFIPHKRNIFESLFYQGITKEDLFHTKIPVLAVKPSF